MSERAHSGYARTLTSNCPSARDPRRDESEGTGRVDQTMAIFDAGAPGHRRTRSRLFATLVGALTLSSGLLVGAGKPAGAAATGQLVSSKSGRCLDADLNTINGNGTIVQLWDCNGQPQQQWVLGDDGSIRSVKNGRCLDADLNTINGNGTKVQLWDCNGQPQQRWYYDGFYTHSGFNARCLDADLNTVGSNGTRVQLWDCNGQPQQTLRGLPGMPLQGSCAAYSNEQIWQTKTNWGRAREQPCVYYNSAVVFGRVNLQIDHPSPASCSLSIGFPPSGSLSCDNSRLGKTQYLAFYSAQIQMRLSSSVGQNASVCNFGSFTANGTFTLSCSGQMLPHKATDFTVSMHDVGGDVQNDGSPFRPLAAGQFSWNIL